MSTALSLHLAKCVTQTSEIKLDVSGLIARFIGVVINRVEVLVIFLTDAAICSRSVQMPTC